MFRSMATIRLSTHMLSDIETCFDLARSIDLHQISTAHTNEKAIAGVMHGLINLNEQVTWQAKHFGTTRKLTSKITAFDRPFYFRDEQVEGAFKFITHDHYFEVCNDTIIMKDVFSFRSPYGVLGRLADKFILTGYLTRLLVKRNNIIKHFAETGQWKSILNV